MTYTLTISLRGTETTTSHETAEEAQTEAIWMNSGVDGISTLTLTGPITSVSHVHPDRADLHALADDMENAELNALDAWGCYA